MLMADVDVNELARKVEVLSTRLIPEPRTFATCNNQWVQRALRRP